MNEWRVGEEVVCVGESSKSGKDGDPEYGGAGWENGKRFVIERITSTPDGTILWPKNGSGVWSHHATKVYPFDKLTVHREVIIERFNERFQSQR